MTAKEKETTETKTTTLGALPGAVTTGPSTTTKKKRRRRRRKRETGERPRALVLALALSLAPPLPFDLSSVDEAEQRRILAEIQAVATRDRLLREQKEGNGKRGRQPTLVAAFASAAASKKNK